MDRPHDAGDAARRLDDTASALLRDGRPAAHATERNRLLAALPAEEYERLLPELTPVRLELRQLLVAPHERIAHAWFPGEGMASTVATDAAGGIVEVGAIGREGFLGVPLLLGVEATPDRTFVQIPGDGWRIPAESLRRVVEERPVVRALLLRYVQYYLEHLSRSVACNGLHSLEARCARWLLLTHDRVEGDRFELTHEFLSQMLGVRRAGVTVAMGALQAAGIVGYGRGRVEVLDRPRLEQAACDCYGVARRSLERLVGAHGGMEARDPA
jgi:CRP-like cAMP-binding protein